MSSKQGKEQNKKSNPQNGNIKVNLAFGAQGALKAAQKNHIIILVDTLRASTTITTALDNGAKKIFTTTTVEEAKKLAKQIKEKIILAGERHGFRIQGFQLGNSPLEYDSKIVKGKVIILTTTNLTRVAKSAHNSSHLFIGCLINAKSAAQKAKKTALEAGKPISIIHVGKLEQKAPEDYIAAQTIKNYIQNKTIPQSIPQKILKTPNAQYLTKIGFQRDVQYCSKLNTTTTVPIYKNRAFQKSKTNY
ncbi:MAG: 2-phosphosulfolactate phosphatase [Candidatus Jordarchaeum sp.]|uniref:2-phosphosulfolactate phosphatase n=1 Tax=Candidatus Jordarchaeum sp. TaxID=2823881 RepID=UPI00404B7651